MKIMKKIALIAGVLGLVAPIINAEPPDIKPHGEIQISYVPYRDYGLFYSNEIKGKADLSLEAKLSNDFSLSAGGDATVFTNSNLGIDDTYYEVYAKADYKNYEFYASYIFGGSADIYTQNNALQLGLKIKIGDDKKKKGFSVTPTGIINMAYVPSRNQFGAANQNEIKTEFSGNVEVKYDDFFLNVGGVERTYESLYGIFDGMPSFSPDIQEYTTSGSVGYKNLEAYYSHTCSHPIDFPGPLETWTQIGNTWFTSNTPLYTTDGYLLNQGAITEFGIDYKW